MGWTTLGSDFSGIANAVFAVIAVGAILVLLVVFGLVWVIRKAIKGDPPEPGTCSRCGYALKGLAFKDGGVQCPECGTRNEPQRPPSNS